VSVLRSKFVCSPMLRHRVWRLVHDWCSVAFSKMDNISILIYFNEQYAQANPCEDGVTSFWLCIIIFFFLQKVTTSFCIKVYCMFSISFSRKNTIIFCCCFHENLNNKRLFFSNYVNNVYSVLLSLAKRLKTN
jgi:hypothetical protein